MAVASKLLLRFCLGSIFDHPSKLHFEAFASEPLRMQYPCALRIMRASPAEWPLQAHRLEVLPLPSTQTIRFQPCPGYPGTAHAQCLAVQIIQAGPSEWPSQACHFGRLTLLPWPLPLTLFVLVSPLRVGSPNSCFWGLLGPRRDWKSVLGALTGIPNVHILTQYVLLQLLWSGRGAPSTLKHLSRL